MAAPLLEVRDLVIHFKTFEGYSEVIDGISLHVDSGERVGLVGETGCGKSVTVQAIMGLLPIPPARIPRGELRFRGQNLLALSPAEQREARRAMAMIFQQPMTSLNPVFTIGDQLRAVLRARYGRRLDARTVESRCQDALARVQLPDPKRIMESYPVQLSGGMRQRVLIALALLCEPQLLLADEPGTALDVTVQAEILALLDNLVREENLAILHITHNLGVVRETTDRVYVMYAGNVVEEALTKDLFARPQHPYTRGLLSAVPRLTGEGIGEGIAGHLPAYTDPPQGCRFHPRCPHADEACLIKPALVSSVDPGERDRSASSSDGERGAPHLAACHHLDRVQEEVGA